MYEDAKEFVLEASAYKTGFDHGFHERDPAPPTDSIDNARSYALGHKQGLELRKSVDVNRKV